MTLPNAAVRRGGANSVARIKLPVIFVPGVMGTRLNFSINWEIDRNWDPDRPKTAMLRWALTGAETARRRLHIDETANIIEEPEEDLDDHGLDEAQAAEAVRRGWGTVAWRSYGEYLMYLHNARWGVNECPLYAYGYDWRQGIRSLGEQMAADLLGTTVAGRRPSRYGGAGVFTREGVERVVIVTHSMGGLVTRAALKACPALREKVAGVMHVVQPVTGGPVLYRRFITGTISDYVGGGVEGWAFANILGADGESLATVASGMAGPMQLLPSNQYRDAVFKSRPLMDHVHPLRRESRSLLQQRGVGL